MTPFAKVYRRLAARVNSLSVMNRAALDEARQDRAGGRPPADDLRSHLLAAIDWLIRAHDANGDGGVARGYSVAWNPYFQNRGWQPSYPETTGYIIPTLFDTADLLGRPDLRERALRMADWELAVQLPSGAVQGGVIGEGDLPTPAVFNTGQVMLGLTRAYRESGLERYLDAARRAAEYLLTTQGGDGSFQKGQSEFARPDCTTYNTRVAWALCELGLLVGETRYIEASQRNIEYALSQQLPNGWFRNNCLSDPDRPLLHTIAYAVEGILECGLLLQDERYIEASRRTAVALVSRQRADGSLAGRFDQSWSDEAGWSCLTGDAQIAGVWSKLGTRLGEPQLRRGARRMVQFLMRGQNIATSHPGLHGGIKGSFPFDGEYGRFETLNWATKFFVDALLLTRPWDDVAPA